MAKTTAPRYRIDSIIRLPLPGGGVQNLARLNLRDRQFTLQWVSRSVDAGLHRGGLVSLVPQAVPTQETEVGHDE